MIEYYKIHISCSSSKFNKDGECIYTGNEWDEDASKHFKTLEEAEQYIIDTFILKEFELESINEYDELIGGYNEVEDGEDFWIDQRITIMKYIVENVNFKKIKEIKDEFKN